MNCWTRESLLAGDQPPVSFSAAISSSDTRRALRRRPLVERRDNAQSVPHGAPVYVGTRLRSASAGATTLLIVPADPVELLDPPPSRIEPLTHREALRLRQQWRENFSVRLYEAEGRWLIGEHDWHVFTYRYSRYIAEGSDAVALYKDQAATDLVVMFDNGSEVCLADFDVAPRPNRSYDLYVCDREMTWTMVFTHEDELGPFFARADSV